LPSRPGHPDRWCALTAPFHPCRGPPKTGGSPRRSASPHGDAYATCIPRLRNQPIGSAPKNEYRASSVSRSEESRKKGIRVPTRRRKRAEGLTRPRGFTRKRSDPRIGGGDAEGIPEPFGRLWRTLRLVRCPDGIPHDAPESSRGEDAFAPRRRRRARIRAYTETAATIGATRPRSTEKNVPVAFPIRS